MRPKRRGKAPGDAPKKGARQGPPRKVAAKDRPPRPEKRSPRPEKPDGPSGKEGLSRKEPVVKEAAPDAGTLPPAPPQEDPRVAELMDKVGALTQQLESMGQDREQVKGVADRFQGMEDRMKSLLQLSEILSVRYNPFLEEEESDVYDNREPASLLPSPGMMPSPRAAPGAEVVPVDVDESAPRASGPEVPEVPEVIEREPGGPVGPSEGRRIEAAAPELAAEAVAETPLDVPAEQVAAPVEAVTEASFAQAEPAMAEAPEPSMESIEELGMAAAVATSEVARPSGPEAVEAPEGMPPAPEPPAMVGAEAAAPEAAVHAEAPAPEVAPVAEAPRPVPSAPVAAQRAMPAAPAWQAPAVPATAPPRLSYWVLCWYEQLSQQGDPAEIHIFLDQYAALGWIPPEHVPWMRALADSVAPRRDIGWDDLQLEGVALARLHRRHLRFLERLFRTGFSDDDPAAWERQAADMLGGD